MHTCPAPCDDPDVTSSPGPTPGMPRKLYRSSEGRLIGGVASGLAQHLAVDPLVVRAAFVLLTLASGAGVIIYAAFWIVVPLGENGSGQPQAAQRDSNFPEMLALAALVFGGLLLVQALGIGFDGRIVWPFAAVGFGVALIWRQADEAQRSRWWSVRGRVRGWGLMRAVAGGVLVLLGGALFLATMGELGEAREGLFGTARDRRRAVADLRPVLGADGAGAVRRSGRCASGPGARRGRRPRARLGAAHPHPDPAQRGGPARGAPARPRPGAGAAQLAVQARGHGKDEAGTGHPRRGGAAAAAEVEDRTACPIEVVVVGDCPLDEQLAAQMQAAREAMVNAAKYGGEGGAVQVYAEVEGQVTVFVRGPGPGLRPGRGARRPHGRATNRSSAGWSGNGGHGRSCVARPGGGTEVELEMERAG